MHTISSDVGIYNNSMCRFGHEFCYRCGGRSFQLRMCLFCTHNAKQNLPQLVDGLRIVLKHCTEQSRILRAMQALGEASAAKAARSGMSRCCWLRRTVSIMVLQQAGET